MVLYNLQFVDSVLQKIITWPFGRGDLTEDGFHDRTGPWHDQVTSICIKDYIMV